MKQTSKTIVLPDLSRYTNIVSTNKNTDDRSALKEMSQRRVKQWSNTEYGRREQKLREIAEKEQRQEDAKIAIDMEWKALMKKEREEAMVKARRMQVSQTDDARKLASRILRDQVSKEQREQILYKKVKAKLQAQLSIDEPVEAFDEIMKRRSQALYAGSISTDEFLADNKLIMEEKQKQKLFVKQRDTEINLEIVEMAKRGFEHENERRRQELVELQMKFVKDNADLQLIKRKEKYGQFYKLKHLEENDITSFNAEKDVVNARIADTKNQDIQKRISLQTKALEALEETNSKKINDERQFLNEWTEKEGAMLGFISKNRIDTDETYLRNEAAISLRKQLLEKERKDREKKEEFERIRLDLELLEVEAIRATKEKKEKSLELQAYQMKQAQEKSEAEKKYKYERSQWKSELEQLEKARDREMETFAREFVPRY